MRPGGSALRRTVIGTPYWMAPEVIAEHSEGGHSAKADVWSLGAPVALARCALYPRVGHPAIWP